jgi:hypothetical protein
LKALDVESSKVIDLLVGLDESASQVGGGCGDVF